MLEGAKHTRRVCPDLAICYYHRRDDLQVLTNLILQSNPNYKIETQWKKYTQKSLIRNNVLIFSLLKFDLDIRLNYF